MLKNEFAETAVFEQLSEKFTALSHLVIQTGNFSHFRLSMFLKRFKHAPIENGKMFLTHLFSKAEQDLSPLKEIEMAIYNIYLLLVDNRRNFPLLDDKNIFDNIQWDTETIEALEQRAAARKNFFEQLSGSLYDLSCCVINTGKTQTIKRAVLLQQIFAHPFSTPCTLAIRQIRKQPLLPNGLIKIEEFIYKIHLVLQACRQGSKKAELTLINRLSEGNYRGIWIIGSLDMGWNEKFKQRHHHLAENLIKRGYLVFCAMNPAYPEDVTDFIRQEQPDLYLVNFNDRWKRQTILGLIIACSPQPVYYSLMPTEPGTTIEELQFLQSAGVTIYYDYFDELCKDIYPGVTPQHFERHEYLLKNPDVLICSTAENLYKKAAKYRTGRVLLSKNGVCLDDWNVSSDSAIPPEMLPVLERKGKIIGFYGSFAPWLDYDMLAALAKQRPDYSLVMIGYDYEWGKGAFAKSGLADFPNVFIIPAQKYDNLKYFSRFFDVGVIPFRIYEVTISVSPVKMFEYMAQGIPVVTSAMPECKLYKSCIIAETPDDFVEKIDFALTLKNDVEYQTTLQKESSENTWTVITDRVIDFIETYPKKVDDNNELLLTIAVPAYNMENYLPEFFEHLEYPSLIKNVEIIIINDGSQDNTLKIAREYEKKYPDIVTVIDKENGGHGSCINAGIQHARGKFFKLVDADDYLEPGVLKAHLRLLAKTDADMVVCDYWQFFSDNTSNLISYSNRLEAKEYTPDEFTRIMQIDSTMWSYAHMHSITYKTTLLKENNIKITTNSFYVDQEYISYPFPFVKRIVYQPAALYCYRLGRPGQSVDPEVIKKKINMNYNILKNLIHHFEAADKDDLTVKTYLLNIIYHHSWFYLKYTDDAGKYTEIINWWKKDKNFKKYRKLLLWEFSCSPRARDRRIKYKIWLKDNFPAIFEFLRKFTPEP